MYQPAHLDSFLRLLITHLETVVEHGELALLQQDIGVSDQISSAEFAPDQPTEFDSNAVFVLQMSQAREWVDRLGQLDPEVERIADEFLASTYPIATRLRTLKPHEPVPKKPDNDNQLQNQTASYVNIEAMMLSIYELLGRLEEQYDLVEEFAQRKMVVNGVPFSKSVMTSSSADIIPLFKQK